jgi:diacylglycerol kinase (ATP)
MQESGFVKSVNAAIEGFIYVMKTERNMRIHFMSAVLIILLGIFLNFGSTDIMILCITVTLVLAAEMINTCVELIVDLITAELHPVARIIKDASAGAVLLTSINAIVVGYMLFSKKLPFHLKDAMFNLRHSNWHLTFISVIIVLGLVVIGKVLFHKGTPLRGGMPSGHAAVAFAMWTIITFLTDSSVIIILTFIMAFLIARHRLKDNIHTVFEVFIGSVLGILVTILVFQLLS